MSYYTDATALGSGTLVTNNITGGTRTVTPSTDPSAIYTPGYAGDTPMQPHAAGNSSYLDGISSTLPVELSRLLTKLTPDIDTQHWQPFTIPTVPPSEYFVKLDPSILNLHLYEMNGAIDTSNPVRDNTEKILESMGHAELVWSDRKYKLSLIYPLIFKDGVTYKDGEIVQHYDDAHGLDLFRAVSPVSVPPTHTIGYGESKDGRYRDWETDRKSVV